VHKTMQGFFLRDLGYERDSFCELTATKPEHRNLALGRRLRRSSMAVGTTSDDVGLYGAAASVRPNSQGIGHYLLGFLHQIVNDKKS
jgi:hypothetical protein